MRHPWAVAAIIAASAFGGGVSLANAAPLLIDDFASETSHYYIIGAPTPPFYANGLPVETGGLASTLGGERDALVQVQGTPTPQSAQFMLGVDNVSFPSGVFYVATAGSPASVATLQYDGDDSDGASLTNAQLLDFALPPNGGFEIDFVSIDSPGSPQGLKVDIHLTSLGGGTASFNDYAPETAEPTTFSAPLASFLKSAEFDATHISSITFVFNGALLADADFTIDNLRAVPEPTAISLAVVTGIFALAWRRRVRA
jgi:hypothetical protein